MIISFIGGGVMAEAIIGGILSKKIAQAQDIIVGEVLEERRTYLKGTYCIDTTANNVTAAQRGEIVILSTKPQNLSGVLQELRGALQPQQAVLSIVAGARMGTIMRGIDHPSVIRVMPNTPAQIGAGVSVWTASPEVEEEKLEVVGNILRSLGEEIYVAEEKYLDMATALSASGPAYVFLFIEALIDAGVYLGMPREMTRPLVLQTVLGSTLFTKESGRHPSELKDMVTSPGGTTAEALLKLEEGAFKATLINAVVAAYEKSQALGNESKIMPREGGNL